MPVILRSIVLMAVVLSSISCRKTEYVANVPFDPLKTLRDHGFAAKPNGERSETRNADDSVEYRWHGTIASTALNDWEVLPGLWRDDIGNILGSKPVAEFPASDKRKPGEPFDGRLTWVENGLHHEMKISLKTDESGKSVSYTISLKVEFVKK